MDKILTFRDLNKGVTKTCHTENIFFNYFYALFTSGKLLKSQFQLQFSLNPSRPDTRRREKINLNFYFLTLWCLKGFIKVFKAFIHSFKAPRRSVKIKI